MNLPDLLTISLVINSYHHEIPRSAENGVEIAQSNGLLVFAAHKLERALQAGWNQRVLRQQTSS
jgi:hypothetical protein